MAKKKKETVVEKTAEQPKVDDTVEKIKVKEKLKKFKQEEEVIKVNLSKPPKLKENEEIEKDTTNDGGVVELVKDTSTPQEQKEVQSETETQETPVVEEITNEKVEEVVEEALIESIETGKKLPENIEKLMSFMDDTGGDLNDYIKLNRNYDDLDNDTLLREFYKNTKPHLSEDEIEFVMEDNFSFDEEIDEDNDIKRKKLALKEQVANAKNHLDGLKSKYYEDIKAGSKLTPEQQKAIEFFTSYNKESEESYEMQKKQAENFNAKTNNVFNDRFKGFEYNVGDKKFRFNVKDADSVRETQGDINNFIKKFLNKDNLMEDASGYHKSLYTAMNADKIAGHFYEQGKADALKESMAKSKNVSMDPRKTHIENVNTSGLKVRALNNDNTGYKFRIKNK
tara:strand:+ start:1431 stop:2618 length:1188 start_codon:yes stop_codon:yes gene_type:complete